MTGLLVRMLSVWDCASTVRPAMRAAIINTGTELLLGDVQDAHLAFIAREIFPLALRIEERRTVTEAEVIRRMESDLLHDYDLHFMTGGLDPPTDECTWSI